MKKACLTVSLVLLVAVAGAMPASAMKKGTFQYGDYTITVVPYDPAHPGHGGSITISSVTDAAAVSLSGEYTTTERPAPVLSVYLAGTIETPDGVFEVQKSWTLAPRDTHNVWRIVVAWIDSLIAA